MSKIKSIQVQNFHNNGKFYGVGQIIIVVGKKSRQYEVTEIVNNSKEYEYAIYAKTESNTIVLLAEIINCPVHIEYEI